MNKLVAVALAAAGFVVTSSAHAEPQTHEGFQFRGAIGGGYLSDSESPSKATISGGAGGFELYAGGFVIPGVSVGGFLGGLSAPGPSVSLNGQTSNASNASLTDVWLGPYLDWYPDAQGGFHVSFAPEFTRLSASNGGSSVDTDLGWGLGLGLGYDFRMTNTFSIGILARFNYSSNSYTAAGSGTSFTENTVAPALFLTFNYH
jgi:hypothetical protein